MHFSRAPGDHGTGPRRAKKRAALPDGELLLVLPARQEGAADRDGLTRMAIGRNPKRIRALLLEQVRGLPVPPPDAGQAAQLAPSGEMRAPGKDLVVVGLNVLQDTAVQLAGGGDGQAPVGVQQVDAQAVDLAHAAVIIGAQLPHHLLGRLDVGVEPAVRISLGLHQVHDEGNVHVPNPEESAAAGPDQRRLAVGQTCQNLFEIGSQCVARDEFAIYLGVLLSLGLATLMRQLGLTPNWYTSAFAVHVVWALPFGFLVMMAVFNRFDSRLEEAARDMAARHADRLGPMPDPFTGPDAVDHALGVAVCGINDNCVNTGFDQQLKALFTIVSAVAEFERDLIRERVRAGIARARAEGITLGRPPLPRETIAEMKALRRGGASIRAIADELGCSVGAVTKYTRRPVRPSRRRQ